jgi:hypothetical protein
MVDFLPSAVFYCTRDDMERYFGRLNIEKWAELDNVGDATAIGLRIAVARANAADLMNASLRGGPYDIPLTLSPFPRILTKVAVQLAGDDLYTARGAQDFDEDGRPLHRFRGEREDALETLRMIHAGQLTFDGITSDTQAPQVVNATTTRDEEDAREGVS